MSPNLVVDETGETESIVIAIRLCMHLLLQSFRLLINGELRPSSTFDMVQ